MHLILTRHGQTTANATKTFMGHVDGKLSELGIEQAKKVAKRLKNEKIDVIYSSDLSRAYDTAKEIAKYQEDVEIITDKRLRERDLKSYEGMPTSSIDWRNVPKDIESDEEMCERVREVLDEIYEKHKDDSVLITSHAGVKMALMTNLFNKPYSEMTHFEGIKNTAISEFEIDERGIKKLHLINCAKHIED